MRITAYKLNLLNTNKYYAIWKIKQYCLSKKKKKRKKNLVKYALLRINFHRVNQISPSQKTNKQKRINLFK